MFASDLVNKWESAKVSHKRVFALLTPEIHSYEMARMLQKPVFALPGCQRMSVNTLLCDTLALAEQNSLANFRSASEFAFVFTAVSLRLRCAQAQGSAGPDLLKTATSRTGFGGRERPSPDLEGTNTDLKKYPFAEIQVCSNCPRQ